MTDTGSRTIASIPKPSVNVLERLSWVLYQDRYWWPSVIYNSYHEFLVILHDEMDLPAMAQVGFRYLTQLKENPQLGVQKSVRVARLLGRSSFEFLLLPPKQGDNDDDDTICRHFYCYLGDVVLSQACKPTKLPPALYRDFHQGLDDATALLSSPFPLSVGGTSWVANAEKALEDHSHERAEEQAAPPSPIQHFRGVAASPAAASVAAVSLSETTNATETACTTPMRTNRREDASSSDKVQTPARPSPLPAALEGSPISRHATWDIVWDKLVFNGWTSRGTASGETLYFPPATTGSRQTNSWNFQRVQDHLRQHYGWEYVARRKASVRPQDSTQRETATSSNKERRSRDGEIDYYKWSKLWLYVLKPLGWHWSKVQGKLRKAWLVDWAICKPGCIVTVEGLGHNLFTSEDDAINYCRRERYHEKFPIEEDSSGNSGSEHSSSDEGDETDAGSPESPLGGANNIGYEESSSLDESEDNDDEHEADCSSQDVVSEDNESVHSGGEEDSDEESKENHCHTPPDSKPLPQDPSKPRLPSPADSTISEETNFHEKTFGEIWDYLRSNGWRFVKARNQLDDWWYVKPNKSVTEGRQGVDYFRSEADLRDYVRQVEEANRKKPKAKKENLSRKEPTQSTTKKRKTRASFGTRRDESVQKKQKMNDLLIDPTENRAPWKDMIFPSPQEAWSLCRKLGMTYKGALYFLPNESPRSYSTTFSSVDHVRLYFCREGIPNISMLADDKNIKPDSDRQLLQRWVDYACVPFRGFANLESRRLLQDTEAAEFLVELGFSVTGSGPRQKWQCLQPLKYNGSTLTQFRSLSALRPFLRAVEDLERISREPGGRDRKKTTPKLSFDELVALRLWAAASCRVNESFTADVIVVESSGQLSESNAAVSPQDLGWSPNIVVLYSEIPYFDHQKMWKLLQKIGVKHTNGRYQLPPSWITGDIPGHLLAALTSTDKVRRFLCSHMGALVLLDASALDAKELWQLYTWIVTANIQVRSWAPSLVDISRLSDAAALDLLFRLGVHKIGDSYYLAGTDPTTATRELNCFQDWKELRVYIRAAEDLKEAFAGGIEVVRRRRRQCNSEEEQDELSLSDLDVWALRLWALSYFDPLACLRNSVVTIPIDYTSESSGSRAGECGDSRIKITSGIHDTSEGSKAMIRAIDEAPHCSVSGGYVVDITSPAEARSKALETGNNEALTGGDDVEMSCSIEERNSSLPPDDGKNLPRSACENKAIDMACSIEDASKGGALSTDEDKLAAGDGTGSCQHNVDRHGQKTASFDEAETESIRHEADLENSGATEDHSNECASFDVSGLCTSKEATSNVPFREEERAQESLFQGGFYNGALTQADDSDREDCIFEASQFSSDTFDTSLRFEDSCDLEEGIVDETRSNYNPIGPQETSLADVHLPLMTQPSEEY